MPSARSAVQFELARRPAVRARRRVLLERRSKRLPLALRQQHVDVPAEDIRPLVAEHRLGRRVELPDAQALIHRDDGVVRRFENRALARLGFGAGTVHLVGQVKRRRREEQRQPDSRRSRSPPPRRRRRPRPGSSCGALEAKSVFQTFQTLWLVVSAIAIAIGTVFAKK